MDKVTIQAEAAHLQILGPIQTKTELEQEFSGLISSLTRIANLAAPCRKPSTSHQVGWWTAEVKEAVQETRKAKRMFRITKTEHTEAKLWTAQAWQSKAIRHSKIKNWR
jgi:hypothetical protein